MCTSFVYRKNDVLVGMNFDNNGMKFRIDEKADNFTILVDGGRGKCPSFGVNSSGTFINSLMVESNGKGLYRRPSRKVTHVTKLVKDVLNGTILPHDLNNYFQNIEVVNVPDFSLHSMIVDKDGSVWVVEPGRGIMQSSAKETPYFVMSNFSLYDYKTTGKLSGCGTDRYETAEKMLSGADNLDTAGAFKVLKAAVQKDGDWTTDLSMVYSQKENSVYYCLKRDFKNIHKFSFQI